MNKAELIDALEPKLGSKKAASDAVEAVTDVIIREVAKGGSVGITGFGTFERADRRARTGRNPKTGETVRIKKTRVPKFRPGTNFKEIVSGAKKVAKGTSAAARASAGTASVVAAPAKAAAKKTTAKKAAPAKKATPAKAVAPAKKSAPAKTTSRGAARNEAATVTAWPKKYTGVGRKKAAPTQAAAKSTATKTTAKAAAPAKTAAKKTTTAAKTATKKTATAAKKTTTRKAAAKR